jgi:hypothetical protein
VNKATVVGNVGLGPNEAGHLQHTTDTGSLVVDSTAFPHIGKGFSASGGTVTQDLSQAASDARAAATADAALAPTQVFKKLTSSVTITGNGGTNVISVKALDYHGQTLTLVGGANDVFIFDVTGGFDFAHSQVTLSGGVTATHVLFDFPTAGPAIELNAHNNVLVGTFLAPYRDLNYEGSGVFTGGVIARNIDLHDGAKLTGATFALPVATASLAGVVTVSNGSSQQVTITLTGTDDLRHTVSLTTVPATDGSYSFKDLRAGTYMLTQVTNFTQQSASVGTVNGTLDGTTTSTTSPISNINLLGGNAGVNYNFTDCFAGS